MSSVIDSFGEQRRVILAAGGTPRRIVFSHAGFMQASRIAADSFAAPPWSGFMGLPYRIDHTTDVPIAVLDTEEVRDPGAVRVSVNRIDESMTMEVIGSRLTAAQLCDVIRGWLDADCQKWGDFEKELDAVVTRHGRFE